MQKFLWLICWMAFGPVAYGQALFGNARKITMEEGLSHYRVYSFYPDVKGMWIGTADGLNYYDGFQWTHWKQEDQQLSFKTIDFLCRDADHQLWLFHAQGTNLKDQVVAIDILAAGATKAIPFSEKFGATAPFKPADIQQFFEDEQQRLYFFAKDQLWRYTSDALFEALPLPAHFKPLQVFANGSFAGSLKQQLALVSASGKILFHTDYQITKRRCHIEGNHQQFWVSQGHGPCLNFELMADGSYQSTPFPLQKNDNHNVRLLEYLDSTQQYWVYVEPDLHLIDAEGQSLMHYPANPRTTCIDNQGNLWMMSSGLQVLKTQAKRFRRYLYQAPKAKLVQEPFQCRGIVKKENHLYVGTYSGIQKVDLQNATSTTFDSDRYFALLKDQQQHMWFANRNIQHWDQEEKQVLRSYTNEEVHPHRIWSLLEDASGKIWIGDEGLSELAGDKIVRFKKYNGFTKLETAMVLCLFKDRNGAIWVLSNHGLYLLDPQQGIIAGFGKDWSDKNYLPSNHFQHTYQDAEGIYWLATADLGLLRWNKTTGEWTTFGKEQGLPSANIYAVYEDHYGYLWLSTFNGLVRFHKASGQLDWYTEEDGISCNEFNRISHWQAEDGQLFFGGQNGVTAFYPKDFLQKADDTKPFELRVKHLSILGMKTFRDSLNDGSPIDLTQLSADIRVINLELEASDLFWTNDIKFHYSLELLTEQQPGIQSASKENISSDNHIELFGMPPGQYKLKIRAVGKTGKVLGETLEIPIHIAEPITQTPLFRITALLLLFGLTWAGIKFRTTQLQRRKAELEKMVQERTEQIFQDQKTIQSQAKEIAQMRQHLQTKDQQWLDHLEDIISSRLQDSNLDLPSIIADLDIGRSQFFEKVKSLTNRTPNQFIQELRLSKAKEMLDAGEVKTVKEVAFAVGIRRPGYFSKLFKERFGMLPSEYFRRHKN